ncbi:MAG TPA: hypothetical protein GXX40_05590 [Firmicutes bacterium]|nr:hypothetical protein [Bacillota bacterium]
MGDPQNSKTDVVELARMLTERPQIAATLLAVARAILTVEYGEITVKMQGGKPVWVDSVKRERVG